MPTLSNARHEKFAQAIAGGKTADEAYALAGYAPQRQNAHRLMTNDDVRARIDEIKGRAAEGLNVTLQWLIERAEEARKQAMSLGQPSAAVGAIKEIGILSGKRIERRENVTKTLDQMTDDELMAIANPVAGMTPH